MQIDYYFNIKRLYYLLKKDIFLNLRFALVCIATGMILILIGRLIIFYYNPSYGKYYYLIFQYILFGGGLILTSLAFSDLNSPQNTYNYLTLPSATFEKVVSRLLLTSFGYAIFALLLFSPFAVLIDSLINLIFNSNYRMFNPFDADNIIANIKLYFVVQSVFLFGAVYFKKNTFVKTILTVSIVCLVLVLFILFIVYIIYWDVASGFPPHYNFQNEKFYSYKDFLIQYPLPILSYLFWYVTAPFFWIVTYIKLKERQELNGV